MTSLRDDLQRLGRWLRGKQDTTPVAADTNRDFWALKDVSFTVEPGEVLGVIGRNGAGKSTLLKILSRITEPTTGEIRLRGRVGSLLEVGTGFHPELSGRDNIYLNGAILGMTRAEISRKFDEVVEFAEVSKFIDTPVKRYSSGMYVRLAFAIAAHLEPEILIVDEVLAVGDAQFQRKCLGKMHEVSHNHGRTILFVSHNMNAVESLCDRCICLGAGRVLADGKNVHDIVRTYFGETDMDNSAVWTNSGDEYANEWFHPSLLSVVDAHGEPLTRPATNSDPLTVVIDGEVLREDPGLQVGFGLHTADGELLFWSTAQDGDEARWPKLARGPVRLTTQIPARLLNEGNYRLDLFLGLYHRQWIAEPGVRAPVVRFEIQGGLSDSPFWIERRPGVLGPVLPWSASPKS
jgi:lipopolysaccharide transport system ATP-binding protein